MAPLLRAFADLPEDMSSVPSTHPVLFGFLILVNREGRFGFSESGFSGLV